MSLKIHMQVRELHKNNLIPREDLALYDFTQKLDELKNKPGCYAFVDFRDDEIVYIGKAAMVKNRIHKYTSPYQTSGFRYERFDEDTEFFLLVWYTECRAELETLLIDVAKPKYNRNKGECNISFIKEAINNGAKF